MAANWAQFILSCLTVVLTILVIPAAGHALAVWRDLDRIKIEMQSVTKRLDKSEERHEVQSGINASIQTQLSAILVELKLLTRQSKEKDEC